MSLKACERITAPMLRWKQEVKVVRVKCLTCPYFTEQMTATCLRDMDYYLRLISYSIAAGDSAPIQEIGIVGVRQMYQSLGTPIESVAKSVRAMKEIATSILPVEDITEVGMYFDYLAAALD